MDKREVPTWLCWSWLDRARFRCFNASPIPKIVAFPNNNNDKYSMPKLFTKALPKPRYSPCKVSFLSIAGLWFLMVPFLLGNLDTTHLHVFNRIKSHDLPFIYTTVFASIKVDTNPNAKESEQKIVVLLFLW